MMPVKDAQADQYFMALALAEAEATWEQGNYPVGAVLSLNGEFLAKGRNSLFTDKRWAGHAEHNVLAENSRNLAEAFHRPEGYDLCLYTTLEPCLMCLGIALMHRVSRIVIACPDPHGGAMGLMPQNIGVHYHDKWPEFEFGLFKERSYDLIIAFLKTDKFSSAKQVLALFEAMKVSW